MKTRSGMIYVSFALIASTVLLSVAFLSVNQPAETNAAESLRIGEASFFLDSVLGDMDRSLSMATRRALTASTNYVIQNNEPLSDPGENISSALVNGTISDEELNTMEDVSIDEWSGRVANIASDSGYDLEAEITDYGFNASGLEIESYYAAEARLMDPVTLAVFNRSNSARANVSAHGLEDVMLLLQSKGRYVNQYKRCGFDDPADIIVTGNIYSNTYGYGNATVNPGDLSSVDSPGDKILVVDDVDSYAVSDVNNFDGVVSADSNSSSGYSNAYVFNTGSISGISDGQRLIVNEDQVWRSGFQKMINGCYVPSPRGPDVLERLGNKMVAEDEGIATMVDVSELPSELRKVDSAVGYAYFNESGYDGLNQVKGPSDQYAWFRLDDYHIDLWNLDDLVK